MPKGKGSWDIYTPTTLSPWLSAVPGMCKFPEFLALFTVRQRDAGLGSWKWSGLHRSSQSWDHIVGGTATAGVRNLSINRWRHFGSSVITGSHDPHHINGIIHYVLIVSDFFFFTERISWRFSRVVALQWPWKCAAQNSCCREHNWWGPQPLCPESTTVFMAEAPLPSGCSQPRTTRGRDAGKSRTLWLATLAQGFPIGLAKIFLELCCYLRCFLPSPFSFLLSLAGARSALQYDDSVFLLLSLPLFSVGVFPNKSPIMLNFILLVASWTTWINSFAI